MQLAYLKMHGAGNQIVIADQRITEILPPAPEVLRRLSNAQTGPGFDQLMWLDKARSSEASASYRVFNADGSEVEQCGNGVRCVAWMLAQEDPERRHLYLDSPAGLIEARVLDDNRVAVNMGAPQFDPACIPFICEDEAERYTLDVEHEVLDVAVLSMGNPHCILDVADVATAEVGRLGPLIEHHPRFPARVNVGFMARHDRELIDLRVHERGAGETAACGTGACAAVVAGHRAGQLDDVVRVQLPGGQLVVSWPGGTEPVWLTGDAEWISEGMVDL
jgi:diaminopimelate epimerase